MNNGPHVLVVSRDQMLLQTRSLILGTYFQVEPAGRVREAEAVMAKICFDLVILCYSLTDDDYRRMLDLCACQSPYPRILTLHNGANCRSCPGADGVSAMESGPYQLLKKTAELVGFALKPMGRAAQAS
jgi:hypothetical protein